ncbi:DNA polymerase III subunit delta [Rhodobacter sp. Har01]|uniref:DNA polymerase III subunit delta n=1 Tax=Rhodobacter sp. Har01 TaxID=2883999 RepID=UPI001D060ACB|nr:DNA polymerase III subunit delta [Rhodobacter sp. Har01]MCB6177778.1 DNA polymerase III subunit delta [Rhodobacter sp. Har01]
MILKGAEAARYCARPDPGRAGLLIFGADAMRVALKRQEAIAALIGPQGEGEMRLTRLPAADLRKGTAILGDAIREAGFFPGPRVAFVEDATDSLTDTIAAALKDWRPGDASIVVTAGGLTGKSTLKTLFEKAPNAICIGLYDEPPTRDEIEAELARAGLARIDPAAMADLGVLARALDPGDFRQTLEKIGLYKWGDATPLTPAEVAALAPATIEAEVDDLLHAVAEGQGKAIGTLMRRLEGQGVLPVTLCIRALQHFRALHMASVDPGGLQAGLVRARIFGPRRDRMQRQVQSLGTRSLEAAISALLDTDLTLRSASRAPGMALMERALIRIAMTRR